MNLLLSRGAPKREKKGKVSLEAAFFSMLSILIVVSSFTQPSTIHHPSSNVGTSKRQIPTKKKREKKEKKRKNKLATVIMTYDFISWHSTWLFLLFFISGWFVKENEKEKKGKTMIITQERQRGKKREREKRKNYLRRAAIHMKMTLTVVQ